MLPSFCIFEKYLQPVRRTEALQCKVHIMCLLLSFYLQGLFLQYLLLAIVLPLCPALQCCEELRHENGIIASMNGGGGGEGIGYLPSTYARLSKPFVITTYNTI